MAEIADRSGQFASVWVGDSLLGKPRMESIALLAGIAARTRQVRLGPACMASFPLRDPVLLAYQWASLDLLAGGRTVLVACTGIVPQEGGRIEGRLYNVEPKDRVKRLIEWITLLKRLWTEDNVTFEGEHYRCEGITIEPKPAAKPRPPIWIANNAGRSGFGYEGNRGTGRAHAAAGGQPRRRLGNLALRPGGPALADRLPARLRPRAGPRPGEDRDAPLPQRHRQRGQAGRRWPRPRSSLTPTTRPTSPPRRSTAGWRPARRRSAPSGCAS